MCPMAVGGQEKRVKMLKAISNGQKAIKGNFRKQLKWGKVQRSVCAGD